MRYIGAKWQYYREMYDAVGLGRGADMKVKII